MSTPERLAGARALLRFLARQGRIVVDDVARIEAILNEGASVQEVLEREGIISQKDLALLLAETLRLKIVDLTTYPLDANVTRELKENVATRYEVVPISIDARTIEVVTANPLDLDGLKAVEFATGKRVQAVVATYVEVKDALAHTYRLQESLEQFLQLVPAGESLVVNELSDEGDDLRTIAADAELPPVIKLADKMLIEGIKSRASDIHVEPEGDSVLVRYRVDGILEEAFRFPKWIQNPLVARLKVMAKLDITERRRPQDGRIQVRYLDKTVDMRVSSLPAQHGEKITLRILDASQAVKALDRLGLSPTDLKIIREAAKKPQGMILITGPTGSGKTTTLYALLREIFSPKTNIVTIENPIEYQLKGINQVEVNEKQGLTFGGVLRSVLRQDPDVILLGEIRDKETAQIAFQAASTGHLVLSTVHTNDAAGAVTRLMDLGLEPYAIASALHLVVAQRLVRQLCPQCSKPLEIDDGTRRQLHLEPGDVVQQPVGCAQCRHQGYRSRIGVYEMLPMTSAITKLIEAGAGESMVRQQARTEGVGSMLDDSVWKLRTGTTSIEEVQRVVQIADTVGTQCPGCKKEISEEYSVCPHCSKVLRASCGGCAKPLNAEWVRCPYCGEAAVVEEAPAAAPPASRRSFTALVVDDTATIRDVVRHTLEHSDLGLTVATAEDGPAALEIAGRERPDIVILDISMPGMDGFEVCRRLRTEMRTAFVPVLMLTAHDSEDDVAKGFGVGADDYMVKPFRREGLIARVRRILERTYGSQAVGAPPLPDTTAGAEPVPSVEAMTAATAGRESSDVTAALAELTAHHDALRAAVAASEERFAASDAERAQNDARIAAADARLAENDARMAALVARVDEIATTIGAVAERATAVVPPASVESSVALDELRALLVRVQESQERGFAELRSDAARAMATAEEALASARAAAGAMPTVNFTAMMSSLEHLQGEHAALKSAMQAGTDRDGVDEECERRLRQVAADIEELRTVTATMETALQGETLAANDRMAQELAALQRALAEEAARRADDAERVAAAEAASRAVRAEIDEAARRFHDELETLARGITGAGDTDAAIVARVAAIAERVEGVAEHVNGLAPRVDALATETGSALATLRGEAQAGLAAVREEAHAASERAGASAREAQSQLAAVRDEVRVASEAALAAAREASEGAISAVRDEARAASESALAAARAEMQTAVAALRDEVRDASETAGAAAREAQSQLVLVREEVRVASEAALAAARDEAQAAVSAVRDEMRTVSESALVAARAEAQAAVVAVRDEVRDASETALATAREAQFQIAAVRDEARAASETALATMRDESATVLGAVRDETRAALAAAREESDTALAAVCDETRATVALAQEESRGALMAMREDVAVIRGETTRFGAEVQALRDAFDARNGEVASLGDAVRRGEQAVDALRGMLAADAERAASERESVERFGATRDDVERRVADLRDDFERRMEAAAAASRALAAETQRDAVAAAEAAARISHVDAIAAAERAAEGLAELRDTVETQYGAQQDQLVWLQDRIGQARRAAVKLVRRVRTAGRAAEARVEAREAECDKRLALVRAEALAAVDRLRHDQVATVQQLALAAPDEAAEHLGTDLRELQAVVARLDGDHRRHAADVEERLRNVMRTAAGGFDVQLALLRGKVEVLAKTLRNQVPLDPSAPTDDALLQHRHGLLDLLRQQLTSLQNGGDWRPQRVLDLLVETSLAAAITPFRRLLQLATGESSEEPVVKKDASSHVTDESTSPS